MSTAAVVIVVILAAWVVLMSYVGLYRNTRVHKLRIRLLGEEDAWLEAHLRQLVRAGYGFDGFRRYNSLPSYYRMVLEFWKPLSQYERELKPIGSYYDWAVDELTSG